MTTLPEKFGGSEARVASSGTQGGPWFRDSITHLADEDLKGFVIIMNEGVLGSVWTTTCDEYPTFMTIYNGVAAHPAVAAWKRAQEHYKPLSVLGGMVNCVIHARPVE
ncbi:hypothetical protein H310_02704 [Aphanomyces invadans]|uniref:Uncharacterized protein n=1 Tax=Aphanomyces invadans TaxID=157072 RepID=A0A024ULI3_9STRA|nr:hypothetical protein H310_02704 [Aphanomyces invadans]ETW06448.1 hypothetical protein H310_02704 [Aphanomyces invadans]|eukprot:XP_008864523.1 hypothetical protein H310_02704 [Aphanomyces invadans]